MKKTILLALIAVLSLTACTTKNIPSTKETTQSTEINDTTASITITTAKYISYSQQDGLSLFVDKNNVEFLCNTSEDLANSLQPDTWYEIYHSDKSTKSIPAIYSEVYSIVLSKDQNIEIDTAEETTVVDSDSPVSMVVTLGKYISYSEEDSQALFINEDNIKFLCNISKDTDTDTLEENKWYEISHSDMMTMSLPGIYPKVYSIKLLKDQDIQIKGVENSTEIVALPPEDSDCTKAKYIKKDETFAIFQKEDGTLLITNITDTIINTDLIKDNWYYVYHTDMSDSDGTYNKTYEITEVE